MSEEQDKILRDQAHSRSCPIYWTKEQAQLPLVTQIELVRNDLCKVRGKMGELPRYWGWKERLEYAEGAMTAIIIALHYTKDEIAKMEVKWFDEEHGPSKVFSSRGIGTDSVPGCFVCGGSGPAMSNIAAYVDSEADAQEIVGWFNGYARVDWRGTWGYVKVGACPDHVGCLEELHRLTSVYGRLWQPQIHGAMGWEPPPPRVVDQAKLISKLKYSRDKLEHWERKYLAELLEGKV